MRSIRRDAAGASPVRVRRRTLLDRTTCAKREISAGCQGCNQQTAKLLSCFPLFDDGVAREQMQAGCFGANIACAEAKPQPFSKTHTREFGRVGHRSGSPHEPVLGV